MARRTTEPLLWLLFSSGGVLAALLLPVLVCLFGLAFPRGWLSPPDYDHWLAVLRHPATRIGLTVFCALALFHAAHRLRFTLYDGLQVKHLYEVVNPVCYGGAIIGTVVAAYLTWGVLH